MGRNKIAAVVFVCSLDVTFSFSVFPVYGIVEFGTGKRGLEIVFFVRDI